MKNSNVRQIRVIKRNSLAAGLRSQGSIDPSAIEPATGHAISNAVDNWVVERNESRQAEKVFSSSNILKWKSRPNV
jgi:hypothetical protein